MIVQQKNLGSPLLLLDGLGDKAPSTVADYNSLVLGLVHCHPSATVSPTDPANWGAEVRLTGSYNLPDETLDFRGNLRMQAKLSQTVTGKKSFFLKLADPFFKKDGAGSVVPIHISGTRDNPKFALDLFHNSNKQ